MALWQVTTLVTPATKCNGFNGATAPQIPWQLPLAITAIFWCQLALRHKLNVSQSPTV